MKKYAISVLLILVFLASMVEARKIADANIPETLKGLQLNGAGIRTHPDYGIDLYVSGLYLKSKKAAEADDVINANEPMAISMTAISDVLTTSGMQTAFIEAFRKNAGGKYDAIKDEVKTFNKCFEGNLPLGHVWEFVYTPGKGTDIYSGGKMVGTCKSMDFKKTLFSMFLGKKAFWAPMKKAMLSGK